MCCSGEDLRVTRAASPRSAWVKRTEQVRGGGAVIRLLVGHVSAVSFTAASRGRLGRRDITESGLARIQSRRLHPWWSHFICVLVL